MVLFCRRFPLGEMCKIDKTGKIVISKLVSNIKSKRNGNEKSEINL